MTFFTGKGDDGSTGILGKGRFSKADSRFEALGAIDEASAVLGVARSMTQSKHRGDVLLQIQRDLYSLMAEVAASPENWEKFKQITPEKIEWLEAIITEYSENTPVPKEFIIPGDSPIGAFFALARTITRRAERHTVHLSRIGEVGNPELIRYLNRLSSLCFVLEILENADMGKITSTLAKTEMR